MEEFLKKAAKVTARSTGTLNAMIVKRTASPSLLMGMADDLTQIAKEMRTVAVSKGAKKRD